MVCCGQFDLDGGARLNLWWMLDMTDEIQEYRQFILGMTMLSSIVSILLMRRFVTGPILRLFQTMEAFTPEEDGVYS